MRLQSVELLIAISLGGAVVAGCSQAGDTGATSLSATKPMLNTQQKQIVDSGVRQIIKDDGKARIVTMVAARDKTPKQTNVCGYVSYKTEDGTAAEHRYFIRLGIKDGADTAIMGQVADSPANRAKVEFMCAQAGLK